MNKNYPKHIGLILDGNRRWAKERGLPAFEGHRAGLGTIEKLFDWAIELDIKELTLYCFSMQNFKRTSVEVKFLMELFTENFRKVIKNRRIHANKVKIKVIGNISLLPEKLQDAIKKAEEATKNYKNYIVNFCIAYGGQEEIAEMVKKIAEKVKDGKVSIDKITLETVKDNLYLSSEPDIIIRTSGEQRTSNFLVFQQAYSEWFFPEVKWPDFSKKALEDIIDQYLGRERRFGK